jgi:hypothetical protein
MFPTSRQPPAASPIRPGMGLVLLFAAMSFAMPGPAGAQAGSQSSGLQIEDLSIAAGAHVTDASGQTHGNTWFWFSVLGQPPRVVSHGERQGGLSAGALQTPDGFFRDQAALEHDWGAPSGATQMLAATEFRLTVSTTTPDTPLILDFHFLGSLLDGGVYYAGGAMTMTVSTAIATWRGSQSRIDQWGFEDRLTLHPSSGDRFVRQSNGVDAQGIGLPQDSASIGWTDFQSRGHVDRQAFVGQLDFGLLQPGERFTLYYAAMARIDADLRYAGDAVARLVDPFSLGGPPPPQLVLQGLELPIAQVPEPATAVLGAMGLLGLLGWRRVRQLQAGGSQRR